MSKPLIIEALEEIGPCDIDTLAGHLNQSAGIVSSMLVKYMRSGVVKSQDGSFVLANQPEVDTGKFRMSDKKPGNPGNSLNNGDSVNHPWRKYPPKEVTTKVSEKLAEPQTTCATSSTAPAKSRITATKADRLRSILREHAGEMTSRELGDTAGIQANSVAGLLAGDVKAGRATIKKVDGKSVYQWRSGGAQEEETKLTPPAETPASKGTDRDLDGAARQRRDDSNLSHVIGDGPKMDHETKDEKCPLVTADANSVTVNHSVASTETVDLQENDSPAPPAGVAIPQHPDCITVPTSAALAGELYELDNELVSLSERLKALKIDRDRKGELLLMVQKLEEHLKGDRA